MQSSSKKINTTTKAKKKKAGTLKEVNSIIMHVDETTKGIMEEIQVGITEEIINKVSTHETVLKEIKEQIDEIYDLQKQNNKLLKKIVKGLKNYEE